MGYEYRLDFPIGNPSDVDAALRAVAGFERYDPDYHLYYFRRQSTGAMPDAQIKIEKYGLYLCDNGCGFAVLEDIRAALAPTATLDEL
jgi:hypothetical protein